MEQFFSSLYSIKKGGWKQKFKTQPVISFEIVAKQEDIRFYVWMPKKLKDLIEKQINGQYPDAEIIEVDEYNVFNDKGKVEIDQQKTSIRKNIILKLRRKIHGVDKNPKD